MRRAARYRILDVVFLLIVALVSGWSGWEALRVYGEQLTLSSQSLLFSFRPSVLFAAGLGLGRIDCEDQEFPELDDFLEGRVAAISPDAYPESCWKPYGRNFHFYFHYYLIAYMGWMFRLFGVSVHTIHLACMILHVVAMMALFLLLRLMMGRILSLAGVLYLATSPVFLVILPDIRDYGKAPFFLAALVLMGLLLKRPRPPRRLLVLALALGAVTGIGYGFRQDLFVCLPPAVAVLLFGTAVSSPHHWRWRIAASLAAVTVFALTAAPVFRGKQESGGFVATHTLLQGITSGIEQGIDFGDADYDFGFLGLDTPVIASVEAYAARTGMNAPNAYLTGEYARAGKKLFLDVARSFPADIAARALAAAGHTFDLSGDDYIRRTMQSPRYSGPDAGLLPLFDAVHRPVDGVLAICGLIAMAMVVVSIAARGYGTAFWMCALLFYFAAYPSLLAECRHMFYLAFIPILFTGGLLRLAYRAARTAWQTRKSPGSRPRLAAVAAGSVKGVLFAGALAGLITVSLALLRVYQAGQVDRLLDRYEELRLTQLSCEKQENGHEVQVLLQQPLSSSRIPTGPGNGRAAPAYLAARFKDAHRTVEFEVLNTEASFERSCHIRLAGTGVYFFPVYERGAATEAQFRGIRMQAQDLALLEGLYLAEGAEALMLWPFIAIPGNRKEIIPFKSGTIDRLCEMIAAEARGGFGLWPDHAVAAYRELVRHHPYYPPFARALLAHGARTGSEDVTRDIWKTLGIYVPGLRAEAAAWLSGRAAELMEAKSYEDAVAMYETALVVAPGDLWNRVHIGEIQQALGNVGAAMDSFREVLYKAPESPRAAGRLDALFAAQGDNEAAAAFWAALVEKHPAAAVPRLFVGIALERAGKINDACAAYVEALQRKPDLVPALYRRGALETMLGAMESGVAMMRGAAEMDPGMQEEISRRCAAAAVYAAEHGRLEDAAYLNRVALEILPADGLPGVPEPVASPPENTQRNGVDTAQ